MQMGKLLGQRGSAEVIGIVLILVLAFFIFAGKGVVNLATRDYVTLNVTDKERVCNRGAKCKYLVFSEGETLANYDTVWALKWNSSDIYGRVKKNKKYRFKVQGLRVPFFSWYRNIIGVEEVKE